MTQSSRRGDLSFSTLKYVQEHAGQRVNAEDMAHELGFEVRQIQQAMRQIQLHRRYPVATVFRGRAWRVGADVDSTIQPSSPVEPPTLVEPGHPAEVGDSSWAGGPAERPVSPASVPTIAPGSGPGADHTERIYEWIGNRPNGQVIIRDDLGTVYKGTLEKI